MHLASHRLTFLPDGQCYAAVSFLKEEQRTASHCNNSEQSGGRAQAWPWQGNLENTRRHTAQEPGSKSHTNTNTLEDQHGLICVPSFSPPLIFLREWRSSQIRVHALVARLASWFLDMPLSAPPHSVARRQGYTALGHLLASVRGNLGALSLRGMPSGSSADPAGTRRAPSFLRLPQSAPPSTVARAMRCMLLWAVGLDSCGIMWPSHCPLRKGQFGLETEIATKTV
jgi:hypothetical protein